MATRRDRTAAEAEAARAAIHDSIERARELLCEAKLVIGRKKEPEPVHRTVRPGCADAGCRIQPCAPPETDASPPVVTASSAIF